MIIDTGVLYASMDRDDRWHQAAVEILRRPGPKVVPEPVLVECDWLVERRLGIAGELRFLAGMREGPLVIESVRDADRARAIEVVAQYRDARLGYVDATTVAIAERMGDRQIATVDRRHFGMIRPRGFEAFELLP